MNSEKPSESTQGTTRFPTIRELAVLAALAAILTFTAAAARPVSDDGWLELLQSGGGGISENMRDRPLLGFVWAFLEKHGLLLSSSYVMHWAGWFSMGLVTT